MARVLMAMDFRDPRDPTKYQDMHDWIHLDEKCFFLTLEKEQFTSRLECTGQLLDVLDVEEEAEQIFNANNTEDETNEQLFQKISRNKMSYILILNLIYILNLNVK